jgi:hypothetical protein
MSFYKLAQIIELEAYNEKKVCMEIQVARECVQDFQQTYEESLLILYDHFRNSLYPILHTQGWI